MEFRKIQKTGGSSYIVSLPKEWVRKNHVEVKDKVGIVKSQDGSLVVIANIEHEREPRQKSIELDEQTDDTYLFRLLIGAYIAGFNVITVQVKSEFKPKTMNIIRKFINDVIGMEIIEAKPDLVKLKDLSTTQGVSFATWLDRVHSLVGQQVSTTLNAIQEADIETLQRVVEKDAEVNRIHWFISRQYNILTKDVRSHGLMDDLINPNADFSLISRTIERIGDHAVKIASNATLLIESGYDFPVEVLDEIGGIAKTGMGYLSQAIATFLEHDVKTANQTIQGSLAAKQRCRDLVSHTRREVRDPTIALALGHIGESLKQIFNYTADLSEYVINYVV